MKVLITGTSSGIGKATAELFIMRGFEVIGLDKEKASIASVNYKHYVCDVSKPETLPELKDVKYIVNNAGTIDEKYAVDVNLNGYINVIEKYGDYVRAIVNVASISGHVGLDTMRYAASQGGRLALTKHLAITLGKKYGTLVNSISPGAVMTGLEPDLYKQQDLVKAVANENILKKWILPVEIAEWIYFLLIMNRSMTGQDILIDNGEVANYNFISTGERK